VVGSWRKVYCYLQRAGAAKSIKKKMNKRARRDAKHKLQTGEDKY
jgi:Zn/Cd-binding protein ZinT